MKNLNLRQYIRKDNPFDYIVLGFIMKLLGGLSGFFLSHYVTDAVFGVISWGLIFKGFSKIPGKLHFPFGKGYSLLLIFFFLLCAIMIFRGYLIDYQYQWLSIFSFINYHLFFPYYWLCYLMPLATLIPVRYFNFRLILLYSCFYVFVTIFLAFLYRDQILMASAMNAMGLGDDTVDLIHAQDVAFYGIFAFVPLFSMYLPSKPWMINMIGLGFNILLMIVGGRRGGTVCLLLLFMVSLYFFTLTKKKIVRWTFRILLVLSVLLVLALILKSSLASYILERGMVDSRSGPEDAMFEQMNTMELFFGKGLNGRYYFPINVGTDDPWEGWRYIIETGFYNLVLKGGYVLAITYVLLLAIPAFKGLFKSRNLFCKAGACYITYSLFLLWPSGILTFSLEFLFIWMMASCCMNKSVLKMTDNEIRQTFFYNLR